MLVGLIAVTVLCVAWWTVRRESAQPVLDEPAREVARPSPLEHHAAWATVWLVGAGPALSLLPWVTGLEPGSYGDDVSHARVARDLVVDGLARGWVDSYLGGFPFAVHYPPIGGLLAAGLIGLGLPPLGAVNCLGALATAATPIATFVALRPHVRPAHAAVGALFVAWVAPPNPFVGGLDGYFSAGLLSQALATPLCVVAASGVAHAGHVRVGCIAAMLASATHPQLALAGLIVGAFAVGVSPSRATVARFVRTATVAGLLMLVVYGPGVATLRVPFGWGPGSSWLQVGFAPEALERWFEGGALFDRGRPRVATALLDAACVGLLLLGRDRRARAALAAVSMSAAIAVSGGVLTNGGRIGTILLEVVQPLRALAWAPLAAATAVALALHLASNRLVRLLPPRGAARFPLGMGIAVGVALGLVALPERVQYVLATREYLAAREHPPCGPQTPPDYRSGAVRDWVRSLEGGAFWFAPDPSDPANRCAAIDGLELDSPVPVATAGAVGSHVGVEWAAFNALAPTRAGSDRRAAALGVGHVLWIGGEAPPYGWRARRAGAAQLWSLDPAPPLAAATCVRARWVGDNAALRAALYAALEDPAGVDELLSPDEAVELVIDASPLRREQVTQPCDAHAAVRVTRSASGYIAASVETDAAVDIVLRVTATASWAVRLDDQVTPSRMVAPGFVVVRVPAGAHRLVAETSWPAGYFLGIAVGVLLALGLAFLEPLLERLRARRAKAAGAST